MRQRNRNLDGLTSPVIGTCLMLAAGVLAGCSGASMSINASSNPGAPSGSNSPSSTQPPAVQQAMAADTAVNPAIVAADNAFGLSLFENLNGNAAGNVAISPLS